MHLNSEHSNDYHRVFGGGRNGDFASYLQYLRGIVASENYEPPEAFLNLPSDNASFSNITKVIAQKQTPSLRFIILVGIGGANLGARAIYDAFYGYYDSIQPLRVPKMLFLDTLDSEYMKGVQELIDSTSQADELLVIIASKSGTTVESTFNASLLFSALERVIGWQERVVVISDADSPLTRDAESHSFSRLAIPKEVGGRFSICSAVGMAPLMAQGFLVEEFLSGAHAMRNACLENSEHNPALQIAALLYQSLCEGRPVHNFFIFKPALESLGKWYRQLVAESLGKEARNHDLRVDSITPVVSIGSTDLHSMAQLYFSGVCPISTLLLTITHEDNRGDMIMGAIEQATMRAYHHEGLPLLHITLDTLSLRELGGFMQCAMMAVVYTAHLLGINAFDQPAVELYKKEMQRILAEEKM